MDSRRKIKVFALVIFLMITTGGLLAQTFDAERDVYSYMFRFTRLAAGTLPPEIKPHVYSKDINLLLKWSVENDTLSYNKQTDPVMFASKWDSVAYVQVVNAAITYGEGTAQSVVQTNFLTPGEWQVQVAVSRWSVLENKVLWSKYSDAYGMRLVTAMTPFNRPAQLIIEFR
jgi:hypothetical protein